MKNNILVIWGIVNAIIALGVCYVLIFDNSNQPTWLFLGLFFASVLARDIYRKKQNGE